jgi:hypothetical protein
MFSLVRAQSSSSLYDVSSFSLPIDKKKTNMIRFPKDRGIAGSVACTGDIINSR